MVANNVVDADPRAKTSCRGGLNHATALKLFSLRKKSAPGWEDPDVLSVPLLFEIRNAGSLRTGYFGKFENKVRARRS